MFRTVLRMSIFVACAAVAACASNPSSPTGPSQNAAGASANLSAGATVHGTVATGAGAATGVTVSVAGTGLTAPVGSDSVFTLSGVPSGSVELLFSGNGVNAHGTLSDVVDQDDIHVAVIISGETAHIDVDATTTTYASGGVSEIVGACPALTFHIGSMVVVTDASTTFSDGTCAQVVSGRKVTVRGTRQGDGPIKAQRVNLDPEPSTPPATTPPPPPPPAPAPEPLEVEGVIDGFTGACPVIGFTIGSARVITDSSTLFTDGTCAQVGLGKKVKVKGTRQGDGNIKATSVNLESAEPEQVEVEGVIDGFTGACPVIGFTIGSARVLTDSTTEFREGTCAQVGPGKRVRVKGTRQSDGKIKAGRVTLEESPAPPPPPPPPPPPTPVAVEGTVSGGEGSCPSLRFSIGSQRIWTDAGTVFGDGTCSQVVNGRNVRVYATQADGHLRASNVLLR